MQSRNIQYLPAVDILRGVAAVWILLFHAHHMLGSILREGIQFNKYKMWEYSLNPLLVPLLEGHTAVALFMVLSGFIFTWGAFGKHVYFKPFITNRLLRIYPLYLSLMFIGLAAYPKDFNLLNVIMLIFALGDFSRVNLGGFTAMAWAIAVEFQFYILFPLLFTIASKSPKKVIIGWISAAIILRVLVIMLGGNARDVSYWHLGGRLDQFLLGMGVAFWLKTNPPKSEHLHRMIVYGSVAVVGVLFFFHLLGGWPSNGGWKVIWPTIEGLMWSVVIAGFVGFNYFKESKFGCIQTILIWIGIRSFSIYLLHYPIIRLFSIHPEWMLRLTGHWRYDALINIMLLIVPVTMLISQITWFAIEKPFLSLRVSYIRDKTTVKST
jgi:peptidoglycan/LPS O-acetylase OafA/YrhL